MQKQKEGTTTLLWLSSDTATTLNDFLEGFEFSQDSELEHDLWQMFTMAMGSVDNDCHIERGNMTHSFKTILKLSSLMCRMRREQISRA